MSESSLPLLRFALAVATLAVLGCTTHKPQPSSTPNAPKFIVGFGVGDSSYAKTCRYEAFEESGGTDNPGGIFLILPDRQGITWDGPPEGSILLGDFRGTGERFIREAFGHEWYHVRIIYHADTFQTVLSKMDQLGCFQ